MSDAPASRAPVLGVVVTHGELSGGLVDAARKIAGTSAEEPLLAISNAGRTAEALSEELDRLIGDRPAVIFTDLQTGSCAMTARLLCREGDERAVVFGVNLAILLDFLFHRDLPLDELVPRLLAKGRAAVSGLPDFPSHADPAPQG